MRLFFVCDMISGTRFIFFQRLITVKKSQAYLLNLQLLFKSCFFAGNCNQFTGTVHQW